MKRRALALGLVLGGCAAQQGGPVQTGATGAVVAVSMTKPDPAAPPRWDSSAAVKHLWAQGQALAEVGLFCPYVVHREDGSAPYLTVHYDGAEFRSPPFSLHLRFIHAPGAVAGWGVGCLRRYDVSLYNYVLFWVKGQRGQRFFFRLKDGTETEGSVEITLRQDGWQRVVQPLRHFKDLNLRTLISFSFGFTEAQGDTDIYIDDLEFTRSIPP